MPVVAAASLDPDIQSFLEPLRHAGALTVAVMVSSIDGRATIGGRVGALTGEADQQVLLGAREAAVAVIVGASTVAAEGYRRLLPDRARARRTARGLPPEPELVAFSRSSPPLPELIGSLRARHPDALLVCEGGPRVLGLLVADGLLDQLILAVSPLIVGDDAQQRVLEHPEPLAAALRLLALTVSGDHLFLRYGLAH